MDARFDRGVRRERKRTILKMTPVELNQLKKRWRDKNLEKARASSRKYYHRNKKTVRAKNKIWAIKNRFSIKLRAIRRSYGLSPVAYTALVKKHGGRCAICKQRKRLCIDHCHSRGHVRGLLCNNCNAGIGMFKDSKRLLRAALQYL